MTGWVIGTVVNQVMAGHRAGHLLPHSAARGPPDKPGDDELGDCADGQIIRRLVLGQPPITAVNAH
jgi:hypothetical protein